MHNDAETLIVNPKRSILFVVSGAGGCGKTSLVMQWMKDNPELAYARSVTTRRPRDPNKIEEQYDYVSNEEFKQLITADAFVQWIHPYHDEYYGTPHAPIIKAIEASQDMVFDYCPEGYLNLKRFYPQHVVGIFLMAPSLQIMRSRLAGRGTETSEDVDIRYNMALQDFNFIDQHDYHLINDDFAETLATLKAIRQSEHAKTHRILEGLPYKHLAKKTLLRYY
jgi:guanylate kinase